MYDGRRRAAVSDDERELLERFARRRDETSFRRLYRHHTPALYAMALRVAGCGSDAEELTQEAWCRAVQRFDSFRGESAFRTWLISILINCYREMLRRRRTHDAPGRDTAGLSRATITYLDTGRDSDAGFVDTEQALRKLPTGYREVVLLHDLYGYTHREIATMLDIAEGTSKSQLTRGRQRLRDLLSAGSSHSAKDEQRKEL